MLQQVVIKREVFHSLPALTLRLCSPLDYCMMRRILQQRKGRWEGVVATSKISFIDLNLILRDESERYQS